MLRWFRCLASCCNGWIGSFSGIPWSFWGWWCFESLGSCCWRRSHFSTNVSNRLNQPIFHTAKYYRLKSILHKAKKKSIIHFRMTTDVTTRITFWNSIFSAFFMWTCHIAFSQNCVQRLISLPSLSNAKR